MHEIPTVMLWREYINTWVTYVQTAVSEHRHIRSLNYACALSHCCYSVTLLPSLSVSLSYSLFVWPALSRKVNCVEIYWFFQIFLVLFKHFGPHNLMLLLLLLIFNTYISIYRPEPDWPGPVRPAGKYSQLISSFLFFGLLLLLLLTMSLHKITEQI